MGLTRTIDPTEEMLTLGETKDHLRLTLTDDDSTVELLIKNATEIIQEEIRRAMVTQTYEYTLAKFWVAGKGLQLPFSPIQSITDIKYIDDDGAEQTWAATEYDLFKNVVPGEVRLAFDKVFPDTRKTQDAVKITYVAGYADRTKIPPLIRQAALLLVGHYFERREDSHIGVKIDSIPRGVDRLLDLFRLRKP